MKTKFSTTGPAKEPTTCWRTSYSDHYYEIYGNHWPHTSNIWSPATAIKFMCPLEQINVSLYHHQSYLITIQFNNVAVNVAFSFVCPHLKMSVIIRYNEHALIRKKSSSTLFPFPREMQLPVFMFSVSWSIGDELMDVKYAFHAHGACCRMFDPRY